MEETGKAIFTSVSLFPAHKQIVADFAAQDHRSFSNALQVIIEDWKRMHEAVADGRMVLLAIRPEDRQPINNQIGLQ
jgi:pyrroline-5-carboxylate reductase